MSKWILRGVSCVDVGVMMLIVIMQLVPEVILRDV